MTLALDDFGTGYSSLNYLKQYPIDVVKIDRGFIADLEQDPASHSIVSAIIELAHLLGMTVVAEGVETVEQHALLSALGCDYCQGFYFACPPATSRPSRGTPSRANRCVPSSRPPPISERNEGDAWPLRSRCGSGGTRRC